MAHIENFINHQGGNFIDKSVTLNATQNNTEVHIQPQVASTRETDVKAEPYAAEGFRPVYFNEKAVTNIDFYRTIMGLLESGAFVDGVGKKSRQKDVFAALGKAFNTDFSNFEKSLSEGRKKKLPVTIFENLEKKFLEYESNK